MNTRVSVKDQVTILARAIRSLARKAGHNPDQLTKQQATDLGELQGYRSDTIAGAFYRDCTDKQWSKVLRNLGAK